MTPLTNRSWFPNQVNCLESITRSTKANPGSEVAKQPKIVTVPPLWLLLRWNNLFLNYFGCNRILVTEGFVVAYLFRTFWGWSRCFCPTWDKPLYYFCVFSLKGSWEFISPLSLMNESWITGSCDAYSSVNVHLLLFWPTRRVLVLEFFVVSRSLGQYLLQRFLYSTDLTSKFLCG